MIHRRKGRRGECWPREGDCFVSWITCRRCSLASPSILPLILSVFCPLASFSFFSPFSFRLFFLSPLFPSLPFPSLPFSPSPPFPLSPFLLFSLSVSSTPDTSPYQSPPSHTPYPIPPPPTGYLWPASIFEVSCTLRPPRSSEGGRRSVLSRRSFERRDSASAPIEVVGS